LKGAKKLEAFGNCWHPSPPNAKEVTEGEKLSLVDIRWRLPAEVCWFEIQTSEDLNFG
jgi:hypothetical protein